MDLGRFLEACQINETLSMEHSFKSTENELEGSCSNAVHEQCSLLKTAKLPRGCSEVDVGIIIKNDAKILAQDGQKNTCV